MSDEIKDYLNNIGRAPLLTAQEEIELGRQIKKAQEVLSLNCEAHTNAQKRALKQGVRARERMISANLRLCFSIAKACSSNRQSLSVLDLAQEGVIGLHRAVERFDPARGYKFSTYAHWWIRQSITRAIAEKDRLVRLPCHASQNLSKFKRAAVAAMKTGNSVNPKEIAKSLGIKHEYIDLALQTQVVSLDHIISHKGEESTPLIDLIADTKQQELEDPCLESLPTCMSRLPDVDRRVIEMKYYRNMSYNQIAKELGYSSERVSKISSNALSRLRRLINDEAVPIIEQQELAV